MKKKFKTFFFLFGFIHLTRSLIFIKNILSSIGLCQFHNAFLKFTFMLLLLLLKNSKNRSEYGQKFVFKPI